MVCKPTLTPLFATLLLSAACVAFTGCGERDPYSRVEVHGNVTHDDRDMPRGQIIFAPERSGPQVVAEIRDGAYSFDTANGPSPGKYRVLIYAEPEIAVAMDDPDAFFKSELAKKPPVNAVASEFNLSSRLTAEVSASGENRFDFTVHSPNFNKKGKQ